MKSSSTSLFEAITQIVQQAANISTCPTERSKHQSSSGEPWARAQCWSASFPHFLYWFANTPGLKVVLPSNPYDLKGLFKNRAPRSRPGSSYRAQVSLQYEMRRARGRISHPIRRRTHRREGTDLTIIAMSRMVDLASKAAAALDFEGISSRSYRSQNDRSP